jgi:hypothetical protein
VHADKETGMMKTNADARLRDLAPRLLEALEALVAGQCDDGSPCWCGNYGAWAEAVSGDENDHATSCRTARAAIKAAKGKP